MTKQTVFDKLNAIEEARNGYQAKLKEAADLLVTTIQDVLQEYPEVTGLMWRQYTPYFNDGEACTFGLGEICAVVLEDLDDWSDHYEEDIAFEAPSELRAVKVFLDTGAIDPEYFRWYTRHTDEQKVEMLKNSIEVHGITKDNIDRKLEVAEVIHELVVRVSALPNEMFLTLFGDHVKVFVTKDKALVEEYNHD